MGKYLQDAEQCHTIEVNYFNDNDRHMTEEPNLEDAEHTTRFSKGTLISAKQMSIEDINVARDAPGSLESDTGYTLKQSSEVPTDAGEKHHQIKTLNHIQMPNITMGNTQIKKLPENLLQCIQNDCTQGSLVLMTSSHQQKR